MNDQQKQAAVARAAAQLGDSETSRRILGELWDLAFDEGRLAALDEFQDRFCVCMK